VGSNPKPIIVVVSPFIDKQHGTERRVAEWVSRLADVFAIHIYSQRVDDVDLSKVVWHRIPTLRGPHLLNYLWWFSANYVWRAWHRRFRGLQPDLVFSPGINCLDADLVSVHVVFAEYLERFKKDLALSRNPVSAWLQILHRRLYYRFIAALESHVYRNRDTTLFLIARRTSAELERHFGRHGPFPVVYLGLDHETFNPLVRSSLRDGAREGLGYERDRFVLLLIGNDLNNKGLPTLMKAVASLAQLPLEILVVSREKPSDYEGLNRLEGLEGQVRFRPPRKDVQFYYAAADAYVGASIEDTFSQPPAEAMACGLPVIVSSTNGTSEIICNGVDGLILNEPKDVVSLSHMIQQLYCDENFRERLAGNAVRTALEFTWERNAAELRTLFEEALQRKRTPAPQQTG